MLSFTLDPGKGKQVPARAASEKRDILVNELVVALEADSLVVSGGAKVHSGFEDRVEPGGRKVVRREVDAEVFPVGFQASPELRALFLAELTAHIESALSG